MDEHTAQAEHARAGALYKAGQFHEAHDILEGVYRHFPGEKDIIYGLAMARKQIGREAEAQELAELLHVLHQDPRAVPLLEELSTVDLPTVPAEDLDTGIDLSADIDVEGHKKFKPVVVLPNSESTVLENIFGWIAALGLMIWGVWIVGVLVRYQQGEWTENWLGLITVFNPVADLTMEVVFLSCYVFLVVLGVMKARHLGRSPHWMWLALLYPVGGHLGFSVCAFNEASRLRSGTLGMFYLRGAPSGIIGTIGFVLLLFWSFLLLVSLFGSAIGAPPYPPCPHCGWNRLLSGRCRLSARILQPSRLDSSLGPPTWYTGLRRACGCG